MASISVRFTAEVPGSILGRPFSIVVSLTPKENTTLASEPSGSRITHTRNQRVADETNTQVVHLLILPGRGGGRIRCPKSDRDTSTEYRVVSGGYPLGSTDAR